MNIHIKEEVIRKVDEERGTLSRAAYIANLIEKTLQQRPIREEENEEQTNKEFPNY